MQFLLGYDGSDSSKAALALTRTHAELFSAKVFVVVSTGGGSKETVETVRKAEKELSYAASYLQEKSIECETHQLATGLSSGGDIVMFAKQNRIDQIYVGLRKTSKTQKIILGSTVQFIVLNAPCPVVVLNRNCVGA
jgi:nucleotide-binding universal stress UspA family protein